MNIPSRRSTGFKMSKQSRSRLINWLKEYDQQAHEALNFAPDEIVAAEATAIMGEQITGAQIRYYCKQQGLGQFRKTDAPATPAPQEIDIAYLKGIISASQNLIETLALNVSRMEKELSK